MPTSLNCHVLLKAERSYHYREMISRIISRLNIGSIGINLPPEMNAAGLFTAHEYVS